MRRPHRTAGPGGAKEAPGTSPVRAGYADAFASPSTRAPSMPKLRRPARVSRASALLLALPCLLAPSLAAQPEAPSAGLPSTQPSGGAALEVVLLTMGQGDMVWERFGHNAIWIHDPLAGTDRTYNWGMFDFYAPGYWGRFVRGNWIYEMGVADLDPLLWSYRAANRTVTAQRLNLTAEQKAELQRFLRWNARPENVEYRYDYFRDNCSTRVRDALDLALGGRLRAATEGVPTGTTFRWHSERLLADDEVAYTGLHGGLGPAADRPIDRWEEMFLPGKVQERVREIRVPDGMGGEIPLVGREMVMVEAAGREPERAEPPFRLPWFLLGGLALGGAIAALAVGAARSRAARFGYAAVSSLWALFAGSSGVILLALWTLTDHEIAYRNENLLQLSPLAVPLVVLLPALAYGACWAARPAWWLAAAAAGLSALGFALQLLPGLDQVNGMMIALALPANLAVAWSARRLAEDRRPVAPRAPRGTGRRSAVAAG